jgi:hypothetical protein
MHDLPVGFQPKSAAIRNCSLCVIFVLKMGVFVGVFAEFAQHWAKTATIVPYFLLGAIGTPCAEKIFA